MLFKHNPFRRKSYKESGTLPPVEKGDASPRRPRRDFGLLYPRAMKVRVVVEGNPKRKGSQSAQRFDSYRSAGVITVGDALDAGLLYKDIDYDWHCNYISLDGVRFDGTLEVYQDE
jgi:hypothetical protein